MTLSMPAVTSQSLICIFRGEIGGTPANVCDGRELHRFLEVARDFSTWIKQRIQKYGFEENRDFALVSQNGETQKTLIPQNGGTKTGRGGDRRSVDYHLSLDMAKELSMVENNAKGREARRYFIDMERKALEAAGQMVPASHLETITASEQQTLSEIVARRADEAAEPGKVFAEIWSRVHRKFRIAKYDQLPRTQLADAIVYVTTMAVRASASRKITPLTDEQVKQLEFAIHRATFCFPLREASASTVVRNRLRVRYHLRHVNELSADDLPDALALLDDLYQKSHAYQAAVREMSDAFTRDVLGNGEPWTPFIKRHLGVEEIGVRPDWRALSQRLLTH